jgi:hypothetical protein
LGKIEAKRVEPLGRGRIYRALRELHELRKELRIG